MAAKIYFADTTAKDMTPAEYASLRGITATAVHKAIRKGHSLPGVRDIKEFSRFYVLVVSLEFIKEQRLINKRSAIK